MRSWWEARSLRSQLSADTYLRQLGFLLERLDLNPESVVALAKQDPDRLRDLLIRDAAKLKRAGRLDSYVSKFFEGLKSYLRFHRVSFDGFPSLSPIKGESLATERVPTSEELASVLDRLSLRSRVSALFMAHSGLRPGVLGAYQAEAGLTLADLPDLRLGEKILFAEVPFIVRVPASLSKTRVAYVTFGSSQLASALLAYLRERRESGESLTATSPVIAVRSTRGVAERRRADPRYARGFVVTKAIVEEIHDALKEAAPEGTRWRPYVLA
ncbi:integrase/recombinase, partial [mine drainage metagenome]